MLDGYPLAQQGKANLALDMALKASCIGGLISTLMLLLVAPQLASFALGFSPVEYFALALFGLTMISSISSGNLAKGLLSGMLGLLVSCIGMDPISATDRLTFGVTDLLQGISIIPAMVGLFAITEILQKSKKVFAPADEIATFSKEMLSFRQLTKYARTLFKSSMIGTFIGAVPGTGSTTSAFLAYNEARRSSPHPETFGTGELDGVAAAESANNAVTGAALIPLLTLGIPGDTVTAILLGALVMHGMYPGPTLFQTQGVFIYSIVAIMAVINIFMFFQGRVFIKIFANVTRIPTALLLPLLVILCITGAFACNNTIFDVILMLGFAVVGYILVELDFPVTPMVIAMILGPIAESSMRRGLAMSEGSWWIFVSRPISLTFILISVAALFYPVIKHLLQSRRAQKKAAPMVEA
ncbi:Membrane protein [uncultured delta proteobacterium]|uniref:Membrane protein n=1 Tax=uncultured delta proteobacterium TaxID=34034 RepID=A0A212JME5_9DELT|nr:Membrane protein [uncultured delta proteobacterium]